MTATARTVLCLLVAVIVVAPVACASQPPQKPAEDMGAAPEEKQALAPAPKRATPAVASEIADSAPTEAGTATGGTATDGVLIAYFSWSPSANTEVLAQAVQEAAGGDLLRIEPAIPYPEDYQECTEAALEEQEQNARPEIANLPASLDAYDTIFIGYPIWWHTAPMIIGTFLDSFDLEGKQIYPFSQSQSMDEEQFAQSVQFVRDSAPGASVHDGLFAKPDDMAAVSAYLAQVGFAG